MSIKGILLPVTTLLRGTGLLDHFGHNFHPVQLNRPAAALDRVGTTVPELWPITTPGKLG